ncbi:ZF-HD homeobox protein [Iris pallida]|uniref:ZF-HD homeobox protein n=1 Tax=Iris pallida TaxID=29817 RepID=A0AAX6EH13_IRIPA|nr:ZF-HD homeobox protein [Iris pallida]
MEYRSRSHQQEEDGMGYNNPSLPPQPAAAAGAAAAPPMRGVSAFSKPSAPTPAAHSNILLSPPRSAFPLPLPLRNGMDSVVNATISAGSAAAEVVHRRGSPPDPLLIPTTTTATISPSSPAPAPPPPPPAAVKYKECLRNHAASVGGHVLDGCGEYMAADESDSAMKCAACGCHRSFHRRETEGDGGSATAAAMAGGSYYRRDRIVPVPLLLPPPHPSAAGPHNHHHHHGHHNVMSGHSSYKQLPPAFPPSPSGVAIGGNNNSGSGATTESSSEDRQDQLQHQQQVVDMVVPMMMQQQQQGVVVSKKRFRTKFTAEQKEKMLAFAERVGWRFQKQDEAVVEHFCREAGLRRQVLKVWMHNNKHSIKKQQQELLQQQQQQQQQQPLQEM